MLRLYLGRILRNYFKFAGNKGCLYPDRHAHKNSTHIIALYSICHNTTLANTEPEKQSNHAGARYGRYPYCPYKQ